MLIFLIAFSSFFFGLSAEFYERPLPSTTDIIGSFDSEMEFVFLLTSIMKALRNFPIETRVWKLFGSEGIQGCQVPMAFSVALVGCYQNVRMDAGISVQPSKHLLWLEIPPTPHANTIFRASRFAFH